MTEKSCMSRSFPHSYNGEKENFVFVSYSHEDQKRVFPILYRLQKQGYRFCYDHGIPFASDTPSSWIAYAAKRIRKSELFLVFLSENSNRSRWVTEEVRYAFEKGKPCLVIHLNDQKKVALNDVIDFTVGSGHALFLSNFESLDDFIEELEMIPALKRCRATNMFSKFHLEISRKLYGGRNRKNKQTYNKSDNTKGDFPK